MSRSQSIIAKCPECDHEFIYNGTAKRPRVTCPECHKRFYITIINDSKGIDSIDSDHSHEFIPPKHDEFIDDPNELLMSVAIRELNKKSPDPRWATILINCKKENITMKDEVIDKLQKLPTKNITEILKRQHIESWQNE